MTRFFVWFGKPARTMPFSGIQLCSVFCRDNDNVAEEEEVNISWEERMNRRDLLYVRLKKSNK